MDKRSPGMLISVLRGGRLAVHLLYGTLLAAVYPHLNQTRQSRTLKNWSRQLLGILNIGIQIEGQQPARGEGGCLIVANHVSWLDIFVLNAIHPSRFIAKSEVRSWPIIGWLCRRSGTIFIERAMRQGASAINQHVSLLLKQGASIGLFPEGTTTDGAQVGHFHSALIQPAIDAGIRLCPIALRYQNKEEGMEAAAAFTGDTTLAQSIWQILCCPQLNALVVFTPPLQTANENRRVLARTAQAAIAQGLENVSLSRQVTVQQAIPDLPQQMLSTQSSYSLLIDPLSSQHYH
ncbi:MAG: 1-acyl-sn-glycerol-3-phosphate acyltransferase [Nitrosomonadales bacterium]|nr:1-acyl-sn-glycerol-3-phosphate acyltransferase [Nitrosomonadales bacterium]